MSRVRLKICGVTCAIDALGAIAAGADALGFNGWQGSKRYIDLKRAGEWIAKLPALVTRVAVLVNPSETEVRAAAALPWVDAVQLHGSESPELCRTLVKDGIQIIKAMPAASGVLASAPEEFGTKQILLDSWKPDGFGGTGKEIDVEFAARFLKEHPGFQVIIAGGLTPANVASVVEVLNPFAVDVASGVETEGDPRRKDPAKMAEFARAVARIARNR